MGLLKSLAGRAEKRPSVPISISKGKGGSVKEGENRSSVVEKG